MADDLTPAEEIEITGKPRAASQAAALAKRKPVPLEFNRIELSPPPTRANLPAA